MRFLIALTVTGFVALTGCRGQTSEETPVVVFRNMYEQPRYNPQAESKFFDDGRTMRPPVEGTLAREMEINPLIAEGRLVESEGFVDTVPQPVVTRGGGMQDLVERGQGRYGIYCTPCHDGLGNGEGMVIQRAGNPAFKPPSFHDDRIRHMPDGQLFQTITYGYNNMPAYGAQIPVDDRWAIVAYVRALELSMANNKGNEP